MLDRMQGLSAVRIFEIGRLYNILMAMRKLCKVIDPGHIRIGKSFNT